MGIVDIGKYLFLRREQSKAAAFAEPLFTCELAALIRFGSERRSAFYTPPVYDAPCRAQTLCTGIDIKEKRLL